MADKYKVGLVNRARAYFEWSWRLPASDPRAVVGLSLSTSSTEVLAAAPAVCCKPTTMVMTCQDGREEVG